MKNDTMLNYFKYQLSNEFYSPYYDMEAMDSEILFFIDQLDQNTTNRTELLRVADHFKENWQIRELVWTNPNGVRFFLIFNIDFL